jgi:hypothetical protein
LLADDLQVDSPEVRRFAVSAIAYIEALRSRIEEQDRSRVAMSPASHSEGDHRQLEILVIEQAESIRQLQATIDRVRALRDLAHWSGQATGTQGEDAVLKVSDLNRALSPFD